MVSSIVELPPLSIDDGDGSGSASTSTTGKTIRQFRLTLDGVTVELSSLGASVTRVLLPRDLPRWEQGEEEEEEDDDASPSSAEASGGHDDVVLSYASPEQQMRDRNRPFFGAIVGRVANRIGDGRFCLRQEAGPGAAATPPETYKLERNDGPNHLHGGSDGFWNRIWDASIVDGGAEVRFALVSPDGDQGYPGGVEVVASYSLVRVLRGDGMADAASSARGIVGARLRLVMRANLLPGETRATPICMAGHSYFNLAGHSSPSRILDHVLRLPNCEKYTPLDGTSIPTREVRSVVDRDDDDDDGGAMDFREGRDLASALSMYAMERVGLDCAESARDVSGPRQHACDYRYVARVPECGGRQGVNLVGNAPYGFDHNYVIGGGDDGEDEEGCTMMHLAAILSHPPTRRSLRIYTTAPGLQVYTSNYLDGNTPSPALCKDGSRYRQWQGVCLETQTYPDSIFPDDEVDGRGDDDDDEFARGRCFVLRPGGGGYYHAVDYEFLMAVDFETEIFRTK
jgi:aldose 1-epimerase